MIILGFDPGESNSAFAVVERGSKFAIHDVGLITDTIKNLTAKVQKLKVRHKQKLDKNGNKKKTKWRAELQPLQVMLPRYYRFIGRIFRTYPNAKETYAERFQTRGIKGKSVETVSMMNGVVATICMHRQKKFHAIIAGTWKNFINKFWHLEELYLFGKALGFTPHEIDAVCIGVTRGGQTPPPPLEKMHAALRKIALKQGRSKGKRQARTAKV